jgi:nicotinate-nucleotide pyrophosphorylase (carboxylating)
LAAKDGDRMKAGQRLLQVTGPAQPILTAERAALNFIQRLSGIATFTSQFVDAVRDTRAKILDTRKTTPGLRALEKEAVRAGGGTNHRAGLYDALLIKENHSALAGGVGQATRRALERAAGVPVEVECASRAEVEEALAAGAGRLLLDNMSPDELRAVVALVNGRAQLEASGGVNLGTVREIAETGVDFVSVGALTHSAPALDLSLTLQ